jgi:dimethylargininase
MLIAITRAVSPSINCCELTHLARAPIDLETARRQHRQYETLLESLGVQVHSLPADPDLPDSVFVEDTAIVTDECAIITRPGAASRRPEIAPIAQALAPYRALFHIQPPGIIDGGDVLRIGHRLYVGLSTRSNQSAIDQMRTFLAPYGHTVQGVPISGCLHLKTAVTQVAPDTLLNNPAWVDKTRFPEMTCIEVDPDEPFAANTLLIGDTVVYQPTYPKTLRRLEQAGLRLALTDASELAKAEGALTCCSLVFAA